jgi:hypothetical protein
MMANLPFTLRQAQGERGNYCKRYALTVRAEPVEARTPPGTHYGRDFVMHPLCFFLLSPERQGALSVPCPAASAR